jgi:hypothetical protein
LCAYIGGTMNRLLLAMLALLTGLVTQVAPAQARLGAPGETEIGSIEQVRLMKPAATAIAAADTPTTRQERRDTQRPRPVARPTVVVPTVLFGADRAFE